MREDRPHLFVELCCGSAAVTLKLLGGRYAVPPISYMGSKRGYAHAILWAMGLRQGQGADRVLLCDAGPWGHVWGVLADRDRCLQVASIIRGWKDEDPRQLWERLRADYREEWDTWKAASFCYMQARQAQSKPIVDLGYKWEAMAGNGTPHGIGYNPEFKEPNEAGQFGGYFTTREQIATRLESVAAWLQVAAWAHNPGFPTTSGFSTVEAQRDMGNRGGGLPSMDDVCNRARALDEAPVAVYPGSADDITPPDDCDGVFVYMDPPYQDCTSYAVDMPRAQVLAIARKWSDAGAVVCISEAEPLPLDGWHHLDITSTRKGQKRTFSKQQTEWLTMNRPPAWRPAVQTDLFAATK